MGSCTASGATLRSLTGSHVAGWSAEQPRETSQAHMHTYVPVLRKHPWIPRLQGSDWLKCAERATAVRKGAKAHVHTSDMFQTVRAQYLHFFWLWSSERTCAQRYGQNIRKAWKQRLLALRVFASSSKRAMVPGEAHNGTGELAKNNKHMYVMARDDMRADQHKTVAM